MSGDLFCVFIGGHNLVESFAEGVSGDKQITIYAPPPQTGYQLVRVLVDGDPEVPALFASREAATAAGMACRWVGQSITVHKAAPAVQAKGQLLEVREWRSCRQCEERWL